MEGKVVGIEDLTAKLNGIVPALRKRVILKALAAGARLVQKDAKSNVPVLSPGNALKTPYRSTATVKKAIHVRKSKVARRSGDVGVFVNVKPLKSGRGAKNPNDPFYWKFLEFGTKKMKARSFLRPAANKLDDALRIFQSKVTDWFDKTNKAGKVIP